MAILIRLCRLAIVLCMFAMANLPARGYADDDLHMAEQEIKAGMLYNFLKYTQWPPAVMEHSSSMVLCISSGNPLGGYLKPMEGRTVNQRAIAIRTLSNEEEIQGCHLLLVDMGGKEHWRRLRDALKGKAVLTVSDSEGFVMAAGMIEFSRKDNHISVELNKNAVTGAGLQVQDRLLKLVTAVDYPSGEVP